MPKHKPNRQPRSVSVVHPLSAGIDIGSRFHVVAVPPDLDDEPTRSFSSFTGELEALVQWLIALGITTIAMESTGVYWIPLYEMLIAADIEVYLVNARHAKNVPGRKSDVSDAQWLQQLHSFGLLQASFLPDRDIGQLRSYTRLREQITRLRARAQQHIQKALMQMNVQLHHVVTDVMGQTGRNIISAILVGERDPKELAKLRDGRCKNSADVIEQALHGNYEEDHLFELQMAFDLYNNYSEKILLTEGKIESALNKLSTQSLGSGDGFTDREALHKTKRPRNRRPTLSFDVQPLFTAITGRDLLQIPGLGDGAILTILSECGTDMRRWKSAKHFTSWLGLAPQNKVTGGRLKSSSTRGGAGRAANAFFLGAMRLSRMDTALGSFKRRLAGRAGKGKALVATARKLAVLFYKMMSEPFTWNQQGDEAYEQQMKERQVKRLINKAQGLGLKLVPADSVGEINMEAALA
jgi:transposase